MDKFFHEQKSFYERRERNIENVLGKAISLRPMWSKTIN